MNTWLGRTMLCGLLALFGNAAPAQTYPDRPIRMIVSIAAGSVTDVIMRAAAKDLQPRMKQAFVVENRGGAAGILGAQACAQAPADGYNLCVIYHSTMSYNPLLFSNLPYNPDDFVPVARLFLLTEGLFVSSALNVNTVAELKARAQSGAALNYATLGEGSFPDLFLRWLNNQWGTKIVGVPYRGGGPAAQALAANEMQLTRFGVGNFLGLLEGGRVKALAVGTPARSSLLPNVPTLEEAGLPGFPGQGWWGLAVPKGTPPEIVGRLSGEFGKLFSEPDFKAFLEKQAVVSAFTSAEGFVAFLKEDRKAAEALIRIANAKPAEFKPD